MGIRQLKVAEMLAPGRVLIRRDQLLQKVPLSERTILDMEKNGQFPRRFVISTRQVAWDLAEVDTWIKERQQAALQPPAPGSQGCSRKGSG